MIKCTSTVFLKFPSSNYVESSTIHAENPFAINIRTSNGR